MSVCRHVYIYIHTHIVISSNTGYVIKFMRENLKIAISLIRKLCYKSIQTTSTESINTCKENLKVSLPYILGMTKIRIQVRNVKD